MQDDRATSQDRDVTGPGNLRVVRFFTAWGSIFDLLNSLAAFVHLSFRSKMVLFGVV
jgi:hypothetical protein